MSAAPTVGALTAPARWLRAALPRGRMLPVDVWRRRHRGIQGLLWLHIPAVLAFGVLAGSGLDHAVLEASIPAAFAILAVVARRPVTSTILVSMGLLSCSAVFVHLSDGLIEMHFHYFVMVGVVTLYQSWSPFLVAVGYVVLQHGVAGFLAPEAVYSHPAAVADPWTWAGIHGGFILAMSVTGVINWKLNEALLDEAIDRRSQIEETVSMLHATLDSTADGILVVDGTGRVTGYNARFREMWQIPAEVMDASTEDGGLSFVLDQLVDPAGYSAKVHELYADPEAESYDLAIEFRDGRVFERFSRPQRVGGQVVGRVWSFRDVTQRAQLEAELSRLAFHDGLTGLANQALFRDRLDHALDRLERDGGRLAVLFLDLDHFKNVNDSLGHLVGDELLVAVSQRIRTCLRDGDTAARLGGDEFAVLLEDVGGTDRAVEVAHELLASLGGPVDLGSREVFVTGSIGIAHGGPGTHGEQVLRNADLAMYSAKQLGRNRVETFAPPMHAAAVERIEIESDLRRALDQDELVVHYQPVLSLRTGAIVGLEALVRWQHPTRGLLGPDAFLGYAEDAGLIDALGASVLEQACGQVRRWQQEFPDHADLRVSVNVAPDQLRDPAIVATVSQVLTRTGLAAADLVLEITEHAMMQDTDVALVQLGDLKSLGLHLAVDDFGTGHSSLSYLQQFPIDILKIDRSFVARVDGTAEDSALARAIARLARTLGLIAVGEGVETPEQAQELERIGCPLGQGFHWHRPLDAEAVSDLLAGASGGAVGAAPVAAVAPSNG